MATKKEIALMSHLMRRAGFGSPPSEIERRVAVGYEETVEELLHFDTGPAFDDHVLYRYHPAAERSNGANGNQFIWLYRMVNTTRPLQEKMALFWHHVFATAHSKVMGPIANGDQIQMFREHGLGNFRDLLVRLAKDPAMIVWLDNQENHKDSINENWGRELLELFSVGVGSYTEDDVKEGSRAFTGWTMVRSFSLWGNNPWRFRYLPEDHDLGDKGFLGHHGKFNGEDVIDVIVRQPSCARFISRHLYNFFVADERQVPAWPFHPAVDPRAVDLIARTLIESGMNITPVMRTLFNSDFFKEATYKKVRSPAEVVAGTLRLTGDMHGPDARWGDLPVVARSMGQELLEPPSVEGWHTGSEWINSGAFTSRVNFAADQAGNADLPGVRDIISRVAASNGSEMSPPELVQRCLDLMGPLEVAQETRDELVEHAEAEGPLVWNTDEGFTASAQRVTGMLALIAGTREFQFG